MKVTDMIAAAILAALESQDGTAEIQRNELASRLGCVPSQISYVITSRFTPEQGYVVESRRGGGGYIRITRLQLSTADMIMHIVNGVGESLDSATARAMLGNMVERGVLDRTSAELIGAAVSEKSLAAVPRELRDQVRAAIMKQVLILQV